MGQMHQLRSYKLIYLVSTRPLLFHKNVQELESPEDVEVPIFGDQYTQYSLGFTWWGKRDIVKAKPRIPSIHMTSAIVVSSIGTP